MEKKKVEYTGFKVHVTRKISEIIIFIDQTIRTKANKQIKKTKNTHKTKTKRDKSKQKNKEFKKI